VENILVIVANKINIINIVMNDCDKGFSIFDENGLMVGNPLSHEYYKIYCVLIGKRAMSWIYYPFLFFSSPKQLMEIVKIGLLAEHQGLKYLDLNIIMPDNEKYVIVYKDPKYEHNAYLMAYLDHLNKKPKNFIERLTYTWLRQDLMKTPKKQSRGLYLFLYYQKNGFTESMKKAFKVASTTKNTNGKHLSTELESKYRFVKEYDNFADFNAKLKLAQEKGRLLKKQLSKDPAFIKFMKATPKRDFVFPMDQALKTGVLTPEMLAEIKNFTKQHKIRYHLSL